MKHYAYSDKYYADFGENHPFPTEKYRLVYELCLKEKLIKKAELAEPRPVGRHNLLLVHTAPYLERLAKLIESGRGMLANGENPVSREIIDAADVICGGSYLAGVLALAAGASATFSGGFHHAFPDHEEGFCYFNDVAVAIRMLQKEGEIANALVVDCDLHQGNGTAFIFKDDNSVFTTSIHQEDNYPVKQQSDIDIGLRGCRTSDTEYLHGLKRLLAGIEKEGREFDICFYVAGADPYEKDQLGGFSVSMQGLRKRDAMVVNYCRQARTPLVVTFAGGYAVDIEDVVRIHANTIKETRKAMKG